MTEEIYIDKSRRYEHKIYCSLEYLLLLNLGLELMHSDTRCFVTDASAKRKLRFVEVTPLNKGSLWKIRKYERKYEVFYGTRRKAYCSNLSSCIRFIKSQS